MLQIAICDDESSQRSQLKSILEPWLELRGLCFRIYDFGDGRSLCEAYAKTRFDLLFLDIEMPGPSGLETARVLRKIDDHGKLIFVTAYPDFVFQGYEVHAFNYILKPYQPEKLLYITASALNELQKEEDDFYLIPNKAGTVRLNLRNTFYFYSDRRQIVAVTSDTADTSALTGRNIFSDDCSRNALTFYGKLDDLQKELPDYFCRIHQRYLVNLRHIQKTDENSVFINSGKLPISRAHRKNFLIAFAKSMLRKG